jgi:hypothetical protein
MDDVLAWLLEGDVAIQYQTRRDLLDDDRLELQARIGEEGYAAELIAARGPDGHWGSGFYQPKWTSSHYTLLELRNLGLAPEHPVAREVVARILAEQAAEDGFLAPDPHGRASDACINGMAVHYSAWFAADPQLLDPVVDWLLGQQLPDGGFNCRTTRSRATTTHSSHHTTVSVLEGLTTYRASGFEHRRADVDAAIHGCVEYLLEHRLFRSHRTGKVIHPSFVQLHQPPRWHFDVLRGLEAVIAAGAGADPRLDDTLDLVEDRRRPDGRWTADRGWAGETHTRPRAGSPDMWVTLRALRVLRRCGR